MVKKNPFTKEQAAYLAYIQRWKATGEGLEPACCPAHRGVEPAPRIRFEDFGEPLRRLAEVEFYLIALKNEGKTRGGMYPKLTKEARELRALLLIEEGQQKEEEKKEVEDADDKSTPALLEEAAEIEGKLANEREARRQPDITKSKKEGGDGTVTV